MIFVSEFHNQWVMCLCSFHNTWCMNVAYVASCDYIACANFACEDGVECHGVECVEKPGGCIVHELNVSQVVCVGVECVKGGKVQELNCSGWNPRVELVGVEWSYNQL
jgi:hypothetical protein